MSVISRRAAISMLSASASSVFLGGCRAPSSKEINILYFEGLAEGARIKANCQRFQNATGVKANYVEAPYDQIRSKQLASFQQRYADYDVIFVDDIWMYEYARKGILYNLTNLAGANDSVNDVIPKVAEAEAYLDRNIWMIPQRADVQVLFYNRAIFADQTLRAHYRSRYNVDLKVPDTWTEYEQVARAVHDLRSPQNGWIGCAETLKQPHFAFEFFAARYWSMTGLEFLDTSTGSPLFAQAPGVEALQRLYNLRDVWRPGSLASGHDESIGAFSQGRTALMPQWYAFYPTLKAAPALGPNLGVALIPGEQVGGTVRRCPSIGGGSLGIASNSSRKEAAWSFIQFMTDKKIEHDAALAGEIVTRKSAYIDPQVAERNPPVNIYLKSLDESKFRPRTSSYADIEAAIGEGVSKALSGQATPSEALSSAQAEVVQINRANGG